MPDERAKIYVCYEPDYQGCAERLNEWTHTNPDRDFYNRRQQVPVDSSEAEPIKTALRQQIHEAKVTVCLISLTAYTDPWIAWELETSKADSDRKGLVGIMLHEYAEHPPAMVNSGAMFVAFKQDTVARGIQWAVKERFTSDDYELQDN